MSYSRAMCPRWSRNTIMNIAAWRVALAMVVVAASIAVPFPARHAPAEVVPATEHIGAARPDPAVRAPACGEPAPPSPTDVFNSLSTILEATSASAKTVSWVAGIAGDGEAAAAFGGVGAAAGVAGTVAGYFFAAAAFNAANNAFNYAAHDPIDPDFKTIFTPVFVDLPAVPAPVPRQAGAYQALNRLFGTQARFAEVVVALRTSLDRAEGAAAAGNQLWVQRQDSAIAKYALQAAALLKEFSGLRAAVEGAFVADGFSLKITPKQFAGAQAHLARGLPVEFRHWLAVDGTALRPQTSPEVKALRSLLLDTKPLEAAIAAAKPTSLDLPAALGPTSLTYGEDRVATALTVYANYVLEAPARTGISPHLLPDDCGNGDGNGASFGEPHEVTLAGGDYVFQAAGEFTLLESTTDSLDVQIREQPFPGAGDVSVDTATAMRVGNAIVELAGDRAGTLQLWVDRKRVPLVNRALAGGGKVEVVDDGYVFVLWPDGTRASVFSEVTPALAHVAVTCNEATSINVELTVPRSRFGLLTGMLGGPGVLSTSDLLGGNLVNYSLRQIGSPERSAQNYDILYHQFGRSWRISQAASLFAYPKGMSTESYTNPAFPSKALTVQSLTPGRVSGAEKACHAVGITNPDLLSDCVFDVGVTGKSCFAAGAAQVQTSGAGPTATGPPSSGTVPTAPSTAVGVIAIGANSTVSPSPASVAVGSAGTAYIAWRPSNRQLDFCQLPVVATSCHPVVLGIVTSSVEQFFDPPTVLVADGDIYVFESVDTSQGATTGVEEYVSTNGGTSFQSLTHPVGYVGGTTGTAGPIVPLPGDRFGAGYVVPGSNPAFQANSLSSPADDSAATSPSYATLNPSPSTAYAVGNLGGQFATQLTGSLGVLGVFVANSGPASSPCPSTAAAALAYTYAPISASTTIAELNTDPGGTGSPWRPLAKVDCDGADPVVGGGPSGLGLLETNQTKSVPVIDYRAFSPVSGFAAPVTVAAGDLGADGTLSQDSAGVIYATWLDSGTGVDLAYSSTDGASWTAAKTLFSNSGDPSGIAALASAVNASGVGWAVYAAGGHEYAQRFNKSGGLSSAA